MKRHPNAMTYWDDIRCQRGCTEHVTNLITVDLAHPHLYGDYAQLPIGLSADTRFKMFVWDVDLTPVDNGPLYCPARDAVSETITSHFVWEPRETILALSIFAEAGPGSTFVDMGAQLGWFSLLAATSGQKVIAYEADPDVAIVNAGSFAENGWSALLDMRRERIGSDSAPLTVEGQVSMVKLDLEGAEREGLDMLWPLIHEGRVDNILIEVSPCFRDGYAPLLIGLIDAGYRAYRLPPKSRPPYKLEGVDDLRQFRVERGDIWPLIDTIRQEDLLLVRDDQ